MYLGGPRLHVLLHTLDKVGEVDMFKCEEIYLKAFLKVSVHRHHPLHLPDRLQPPDLHRLEEQQLEEDTQRKLTGQWESSQSVRHNDCHRYLNIK